MKRDDNERHTDRTENMIIIILLSFLITEIPSGLLGMLALFLGMDFYRFCFLNLITLLDILLLINAASNFFVYYTMSKQFRDTFNKLFGCYNQRGDVHSAMLPRNGH